MTQGNYRHELVYYRVWGPGRYDHRYTEFVEDMGFCFEHHPGRVDRWLHYYARVCAEDYLARACAEPGAWMVSVYRLRDTRRHLVTTRFSYPPKKVGGSPSENRAPTRR